MKKTTILIAVILAIVIGFGLLFLNTQKRSDKYSEFKKINYRLENKELKLLVADTPEKWERGLMYFRSLEAVDGMIFIFPEKNIQNFWNKNTFMDLDLYWIDGDKVVGKSFLPSIEKSKEIISVESSESADKVIEIPK